jgi:hypothetical protein
MFDDTLLLPRDQNPNTGGEVRQNRARYSTRSVRACMLLA